MTVKLRVIDDLILEHDLAKSPASTKISSTTAIRG
jgi:hypothetical protein